MKTKKAARKPPRRPFQSPWGPQESRGAILRVTLLGCGKAKAPEPRAARDLYTGALFRAGLEHALSTSDEVRVVSAKHGLVRLDDVLEPYELSIGELATGRSRRWWGEGVVAALTRAFPDRALDVTLLMGGAYSDLLLPSLNRDGIAWQRPIDGLKLGERLAWFAAEKRRRAQASREELPPPPRAAAAPFRLVVAERGQLLLPNVGPVSRQLALFG